MTDPCKSHYDHTGGNLELKSKGAKIYGPLNEQDRIAGIDFAVQDGYTVTIGNKVAKVLDVGGHTEGHIAFYFPEEKLAFVGDALFSLGCGKMFEGTPKQFWTSLKTIRSLPDETSVYW